MRLLADTIILITEKYLDIIDGYIKGNTIILKFKNTNKKLKIEEENKKLKVTIYPKNIIKTMDLKGLESIILEFKNQ